MITAIDRARVGVGAGRRRAGGLNRQHGDGRRSLREAPRIPDLVQPIDRVGGARHLQARRDDAAAPLAQHRHGRLQVDHHLLVHDDRRPGAEGDGSACRDVEQRTVTRGHGVAAHPTLVEHLEPHVDGGRPEVGAHDVGPQVVVLHHRREHHRELAGLAVREGRQGRVGHAGVDGHRRASHEAGGHGQAERAAERHQIRLPMPSLRGCGRAEWSPRSAAGGCRGPPDRKSCAACRRPSRCRRRSATSPPPARSRCAGWERRSRPCS